MANTIYHVSRDNMETELQRSHGFTPQESKKLMEYFEKSGTALFNGPTMQLRDPTTQDAYVAEGLANAVLGRTMGSQGKYQLNEYLRFLQRKQATYGIS